MFLTYEQIVWLTKRRRYSAQARALRNMEPPIPYRKREDGSLVVLAIHVENHPDALAVKLKAEPQLRLDS